MERRADVERAEDEAAQERADDADDDVSDDAVAATDHRRRQPTRDEPDRAPDQNCFYCHGVLLGRICARPARATRAHSRRSNAPDTCPRLHLSPHATLE